MWRLLVRSFVHPNTDPRDKSWSIPLQDEPLDAAAVRARFAELAARVNDETGTSRAAEAVAEGFLKIAVENMANAIKKISVQRGWVRPHGLSGKQRAAE
jgi:5-oxoprolinase (ATP-hydrolysing)